MARERLIAGLDIGTTKTCAVVAEQRPNGRLQLVAAGVCPSRGLKRGVVVSLEDTSAAVQTAIELCERKSGYRVASTLVSIAGAHIESQNSRGVTTLANHGSDLSAADLEKALDSARAVPIPPNREIIHVVPRSYVLDGQDGIKNPIGMSGHRLEAETHVITGAVGSIQNLIKAVQRTGLELDDIVLQPLASAEAVLTEEERELGGVLVDIGGGTTDVAVFLDGSVWHTAVIGFGGNNVSNDIAICLRTPLTQAEALKITYGHADPAAVADLPPLDVPTFERSQVQQVPREYLAQIIQARMEEILGLVARELKRSGCSDLLGAGVVLAGGGAEQAGIKELAESILDLPVRIGQPQGVDRLDERLMRPAFATAIGLLVWANRHGAVEHVTPSRGLRVGSAVSRAAGTAGRWFRAFLP
ncbi:MAG TPA: cell division protein FtsA [Chloroflexota bacterium]|nr:cell division protein FtsA [Chloroflexota bacterium]